MKHFWKPALCLALLCLALIFCAGSAALAESVAYLDEDGEAQICDSATVLTSGSTTLTAGWYAVTTDTNIESRIEVSGDVYLILGDNATLTASKGITVAEEGNSLTIYAQSAGSTMGALTVSDSNNSDNEGDDDEGGEEYEELEMEVIEFESEDVITESNPNSRWGDLYNPGNM